MTAKVILVFIAQFETAVKVSTVIIINVNMPSITTL